MTQLSVGQVGSGMSNAFISGASNAVGVHRGGRAFRKNPEISRQNSERASERAFFGVMALLFLGSAATTIVWCSSMPRMNGMPMPGGWTMSMAWMRMPGQTWLGAAASFLGMWFVMMSAMMLPCLVPMLQRYRQAVGQAVVGVGYFVVWIALGMIVYPLGVALAVAEMQQAALARAVPITAGVIVLLAGALQFSAWKAKRLTYCRGTLGCDTLGRDEFGCGRNTSGSDAPGHNTLCRGTRDCRPMLTDAGTAFRHGLRLGLHCCYCCANLTAILLVIGVMDLRAMTLTTAAITIERLAPAGERVARAIGAVVVGAGVLLSARAIALA
jgi:predicted metal-binding membrane protein